MLFFSILSLCFISSFFPLHFSPGSSVVSCICLLKEFFLLLFIFHKYHRMNGLEAKFPQNPTPKTKKIVLGAQICLRILAIVTALAATWVMLTSKQTKEIFGFTFEARYSDSPNLKFCAYASAVACGFSVLSLLFVLFLCRLSPNSENYYYLFLHDLFMMSLVLAGCAAATAEGTIGKYGNKSAGWSPICDHFGKFCNRTTNSVLLSYLSLISLLMLTILSASMSRQIQVIN